MEVSMSPCCLADLSRRSGLILPMALLALMLPVFAKAVSFSTLYSFCQVKSCKDGNFPNTSLLIGSDGAFYGATFAAGKSGGGNVFRLAPRGGGTARVTDLFTFCKSAGCIAKGYGPNGVVRDVAGNFYGTAIAGGPLGGGVVYELTPPAPGTKM